MTRFADSNLSLPFYEPRHLEFADRIADWCRRRRDLWEEAAEDDAETTGRRIRRALGDDGWFAFLDQEPGNAGGGPAPVGGDMRSLCLARSALAYAEDLADFSFSIQVLSAIPLLLHGTQEQRRRYLPGMAAGTVAGAFALSEEGSGSDVSAIGLRAEQVPGGYLLTGGKAWIANGSTADLYCVIARTGKTAGRLGLTAFLVPANSSGLTVKSTPLIAPRSFASIEFDGCAVPAENVLGRTGAGYVIAMEVLTRIRMTVGAAAVGFARRAANAALVRARSRPVGDGRLFDLPTVRATFAEMEVKLQAATLLVARAAWEADRGSTHYAKHSSIAKLYATEAAQEIVDDAVQIFGAAGLVGGSLTERLYRQIRSLRIYEGTSEVQKVIIAGALGRVDVD